MSIASENSCLCLAVISPVQRITLLIRGDLGQSIKILPIFTLKGPLDMKPLLLPIPESDRRRGLIQRPAVPVIQVL